VRFHDLMFQEQIQEIYFRHFTEEDALRRHYALHPAK
jgi:hypothetical protein